MVTSTAPVAASEAAAATVTDALREVSDPEIPAISIVDLGIVERVEVPPDPARPIHVQLLPTFVGCPAIALIKSAVSDRLAAFGRGVEVEVSFSVPWTSDRISPAGRDALRRSGFAPPAATPDAVRCPYCDSARVAMDSAFGPTLCRALYYCRDCRQPFEAFKAV